ncbi:MAG TPA: bifunctional YncE family protein/alkaline phosphatase family protein [Rhizomicrobium sp.]
MSAFNAWIAGFALIAAVAAPALADSDDGPGQWIPTGQRITPTAAAGSKFQELDPGLKDFPDFRAGQAVTSVASHDGKTLLVLTSGFNLLSDATGTGKAHSDEYIFVFDISGGAAKQVQVLTVPNSDSGIAFAPDDSRFAVSGGVDDNVHIFARTNGQWAEDGAAIPLGHRSGLGLAIKPSAAGIALTADGKKAVIADRYNDAITVVDLAARKAIAELDLRPGKIDPAKRGVAGGEYPYWVQIAGNATAYITSQRDHEVDVVDIAGAPRLVSRIAVPGNPNRLVLNKAQSRLFVASDNTDTVTAIDTASQRVIETIDASAPPGLIAGKAHVRGAAPNSLSFSPDEQTLYVTLGGENAVAVISLAGAAPHRTTGLIPTGWYPNSVTASGGMLYVVNGRSDPGPNPKGCMDNASDAAHQAACRAANRYILQLSHAGLLTLPVPPSHDLGELTGTVAANNGLRTRADPRDAAVMRALHRRIKHVIYIVKENRTYDQVLGDLGRGNGDPSLTLFGETITPNEHALARRFVTLDNFYDSGEVSGNGWPWSTDASESDIGVKQIPMQYAGRGQSYDVEGTNRNINVALPSVAARRAADPATPDDPDLLPGTDDVAAPMAPKGEKGRGHLWDAALRANLSVRNYGFYCDLSRYDPRHPNQVPRDHDPFASHVQVAWSADPALLPRTDPYFRSFDTSYPDFWREKEWEREFALQVRRHDMPSLSLVRFMTDHMGSFDRAIDGVNTPEREVADNDYAVGKLIEALSRSPYRDSTLIFVIEDDAQDGPDHVDAHRSIAFVAGPYVRQGVVVSERYTTVNMLRTIEDILGIEPLSLNDAHQRPMTAVFDLRQRNWTFSASPSAALRQTQLPLPAEPRGTGGSRRFTDAHSAAYWATKTKGYDWSKEDRIPSAAFNAVLWQGLAHRSGAKGTNAASE